MKLELSDEEAESVYRAVGLTTDSQLWNVFKRLQKLLEAKKEKQEKLNSLRAKHKQLLEMRAQAQKNIEAVLVELDTLEKLYTLSVFVYV